MINTLSSSLARLSNLTLRTSYLLCFPSVEGILLKSHTVVWFTPYWKLMAKFKVLTVRCTLTCHRTNLTPAAVVWQSHSHKVSKDTNRTRIEEFVDVLRIMFEFFNKVLVILKVSTSGIAREKEMFTLILFNSRDKQGKMVVEHICWRPQNGWGLFPSWLTWASPCVCNCKDFCTSTAERATATSTKPQALRGSRTRDTSQRAPAPASTTFRSPNPTTPSSPSTQLSVTLAILAPRTATLYPWRRTRRTCFGRPSTTATTTTPWSRRPSSWWSMPL